MAATSTLPPVRTSNYLPQALAPSISEETISLWLKLGAMEKLEQAVLDGYGDLLIGRTARLPQVNKFLRQVPMFQNKIYEIHNAVSKGKLRELQHLVDRKKLASCRDHIGATPLHKAVIFGHKDIILYLLDRYDATLHIRDHQGRTPLHYAAFLSDGGEIYQMLIDAGADIKAIDAYGNIPEYYMKMQDETALQELREGYLNNDIRKIKPKKSNPLMKSQKGYSKSTVGRVQIKELINKGNLEALEDIILRGHGGLLLGETSPDPTIQDFLTMVPFYLKRIHDVHRAAMRGRLQEIAKLLDHKSFAIATDQLGATPLHKAVWYENYDIVEYIVNNFPLSLNIADMDGRTPLHYAAALRDNKDMYNILLNAGASKSIQDIKGKTSDFYLQHPELLRIDEVIRRNQRINATHMANIINHTRSKLPLRHTPPMGKDGFSSSSTSEKSGQEIDDEMSDLRNEDKDNEESQHTSSNLFDSKTESLIKSLPPLPPLKLQRLDITSANIRKWMTEEDIDKLKQAVIDGYGEIISRENSENKAIQEYISHFLPVTMNKIHAIHNAVSQDDLTELKSLSMDNEELIFAKDNFGMTSLHKAVILGHTKIVKFLADNFPEIINITDKDGRTALHYATAASRKESISIYRILIQAGADPKIRDMQGRTADYYRTHRMPTTLKSPLKPKTSPNTMQNQSELARFTRQAVLEKITSILQKGDVEMLKEIVLEGYGKHLLGRTSWNEETRQYLKTLPQYLSTIRSLQEAVIAGDINTVEKRINDDEKLLKSKDETGFTPIHLAIIHNKPEVVSYLTKHYPIVLNLKDINGRTPLHLAAQENYVDLYKIIKDNGADPMILDQKGRTAEYYLNISEREDERSPRTPSSSENFKMIANEELEKSRQTNIDDSKENKETNNESEETVLNNNTDNSTSGKNSFEEEKKIINSESNDSVNENNVKEPLSAENIEDFNSNKTTEKIESVSKQLSFENENLNEKKKDLEKTEKKNNSSNENEQTKEDNNNIKNNNNNSECKEDINNLDKKSIDTKNSEEIMNMEYSEQDSQQEGKKIVDLIPEMPNTEEDKNAVKQEINNEEKYNQNEEKESHNQQENETNEENNKTDNNEINSSNTLEEYSESALEDSKSINTEDINSENKNDKLIAVENNNNNNEETIKTNTVESAELSDNTDNNSKVTETNEGNNKQEILQNSNNDEQNETELQNSHFTGDNQGDNVENNEKNEEEKNNEENKEEKNNEKNAEEKNNENNEEGKNIEKNEEGKNNDENDERQEDKEINEKDNAISKEENDLPQNNEENVANEKEENNLIQTAEQNENNTKEENNLKETIDQNKANNTEEEDSIQNVEQNNAETIHTQESINNIKEETNTTIENKIKEKEENNEQKSTNETDNQEITKETDKEKDSLKNVNVDLETDNPNASKLSQHENDIEVNAHNNAEIRTADDYKLTNKNSELDTKENNLGTKDTENNINEPQNLESNIKSEKDKETNIDDVNKNNRMSSDDLNSEINKNNIQTENSKTSNENKNNFPNRIKNNSGIKSRNSGSRNSSQKDYLDDLIEQWIREGDLLRLEHVVLAGQGDRLIEKTSDDKQVQDFLDLVPIYTAKIRAIHEAVIRGNLREVRAVLTRKRFALSRDHVGASPLHLAVLHRHADIVQYIISHFPETMDGPDNEGRTPLHYAAVIPDEGYLYKIIKTQGADENIKDKMGITPRYYLENGGQLTVQDLWDSYKSGEEQ